jgi:hypothetical protein
MIAPLDPEVPATGSEGEKVRVTGLKNLTYVAMYDAKVSKGVGILISKDGEYIQIDWALLNVPWAPDPEMDVRLAQSNPFREVKEKLIKSFLFTTGQHERSHSGRTLVIEPDAKWRGMWRVGLPDGQLSDMVNLTRGKDAAASLGRVRRSIAA